MPARAGLLFYQLLFTEDAKTVVQSTKFKVTPNKTVCFYIHLESILAAKHTWKGNTLHTKTNTNQSIL